MSEENLIKDEFPFTDQELLDMTMTENKFAANLSWKKAFKLYNENNRLPLSVNCLPCYWKVFNYILRLRFDL